MLPTMLAIDSKFDIEPGAGAIFGGILLMAISALSKKMICAALTGSMSQVGSECLFFLYYNNDDLLV